MPVTSQSVAGGAEFDGLTVTTGLFAFGSTGGRQLQVRINSISFSTGGTITDWTLSMKDPSSAFAPVILTDTTTTFMCGGPGGFMLLPNGGTTGQLAYQLVFVTTGLSAAATIKVDHDVMGSES